MDSPTSSESSEAGRMRPSPLAREGGAKRRMRGPARSAAMQRAYRRRPLIRPRFRRVHLLPQGEKGFAEPSPMSPNHHQYVASGIDALRSSMKARIPSSFAGSSGGASYSASIVFHKALARVAASFDPSSIHCSTELLSATLER